MTKSNGGEHVATQVANPIRASIRTIVQTLIVLIPLVNLAAVTVIDYLNSQTDVVVPGWAFLVLNGIVVGTSLLIGLATRLMALPSVNAWIVSHASWAAPSKPLN